MKGRKKRAKGEKKVGMEEVEKRLSNCYKRSPFFLRSNDSKPVEEDDDFMGFNFALRKLLFFSLGAGIIFICFLGMNSRLECHLIVFLVILLI